MAIKWFVIYGKCKDKAIMFGPLGSFTRNFLDTIQFIFTSSKGNEH